MKLKTLVLAIALPALAITAGLGAAIAWGGPDVPQALPSMNDPFHGVDFSGMPPLTRFTARDGAALAYRHYRPTAAAPRGSVVLVHGSSASSNSMHPLARALSEAGYAAYALDVRGHGASGVHGHVAYVGQLEDDLEDFAQAVRPAAPSTLAGFSAGGGFALRVAGSPRQQLFNNYLLLSPFVSHDAPTYRPASGGWVNVGMARIVALTLLDSVGVRRWNDLPVIRFALNERLRASLTPSYSFSLSMNFRPRLDYARDLGAMRQPTRVLVGATDEAFHADRFAGVFSVAQPPVPVTVLPALGHIALTLDGRAHSAAVAAIEAMRPQGR